MNLQEFVDSMYQASADLETLRGRLQELLAKSDPDTVALADEIGRHIESFINRYTFGLEQLFRSLETYDQSVGIESDRPAYNLKLRVKSIRDAVRQSRQAIDPLLPDEQASTRAARQVWRLIEHAEQYAGSIRNLATSLDPGQSTLPSDFLEYASQRLEEFRPPDPTKKSWKVLPGTRYYKSLGDWKPELFAETPGEIAHIVRNMRVTTDLEAIASNRVRRQLNAMRGRLRDGPGAALYSKVDWIRTELSNLEDMLKGGAQSTTLIPRARSVFGRIESLLMSQMEHEGSTAWTLDMIRRSQQAIETILDMDPRASRSTSGYYKARELYTLLGEIINDQKTPLRTQLERRKALLAELGLELTDDDIAGMTVGALRQRRALAWREVARTRDSIKLYKSLDRLYTMQRLLEQDLPYVDYDGVLDPSWTLIDDINSSELQGLKRDLAQRDRPPLWEARGEDAAVYAEHMKMRDWWEGRPGDSSFRGGRYKQLLNQVENAQRRYGLTRRQAIARVLRERSPYAQLKETTMMGSYLTLQEGQTTRIVPVNDILQSFYALGGNERLPFTRPEMIHGARGTPEEIARLLVTLRSMGTDEAKTVEQRILGLLDRGVRHRAVKMAQELQVGDVTGLVGQWVTFKGQYLPFQVKSVKDGMAVVEPMTLAGLVGERKARLHIQGTVLDMLKLVWKIPGTKIDPTQILDQALILNAIRKRGLPTVNEPVTSIAHAAQKNIDSLRQIFESSSGFGAYAQDVSRWGAQDMIRSMAEIEDPVYGFRYGKSIFEALAAARPELFIDYDKNPDRLMEALQTAWVTAREIIDEDPTIFQKPNWESLLRGKLQARAHGILRGASSSGDEILTFYERAAMAIRSGLSASRGTVLFEDFAWTVYQLPAMLETMNLDDATKEEYLKLAKFNLAELKDLWESLDRQRPPLSLDAPLRNAPFSVLDPEDIVEESLREKWGEFGQKRTKGKVDDEIAELPSELVQELTEQELAEQAVYGGRAESLVDDAVQRIPAGAREVFAPEGTLEDVLDAKVELETRLEAKKLGIKGARSRPIADLKADIAEARWESTIKDLESKGRKEEAIRARREQLLQRVARKRARLRAMYERWSQRKTPGPEDRLEELFRELASIDNKEYKQWLLEQNADTIRQILPHVQGAEIRKTEEELAGWVLKKQVAFGRDLREAMEDLLPKVAGQHIRISLPGADPILVPKLIEAEALPSSVSFHLETGGMVQPLDREILTHNWDGAVPSTPGFRLGLSGYQILATPDAPTGMKVPVEVLLAARQLEKDPLRGDLRDPIRRGGMIVQGEPLPFYRFPHASTMGLGNAAYSFPEVFSSLDRLKPGSRITAIDVETTGLLDDMRRAGLSDLFLPTEIGTMQYEVVEEGGQLGFRPVKGTYNRILVKPTEAQAEQILDIITRPGRIEAGSPEASVLAAYARFADPRYQDPSRLSRLLAIEGGEAQLRESAAQGLEILRRKRTVTIKTAMKRTAKLLRGEDSLVVGMNAARADIMWLTEWAKRQGISTPDVAVLDPMALARIIGKEAIGAEGESLGALAEALGVDVESAHAAITRRGSRYVGDVPTTVSVLERILNQHGDKIAALREQMEGGGRLEVGDLLWATSRRAAPGADPLWRVAAGWTERGGVLALALENVETGNRRVLSARNAGQLASQLAEKFAYITREEAEALNDFVARDRARREVIRGYERKSSYAFTLAQKLDAQTRQTLEEEILQRSPAYAKYKRYIDEWYRTDEGIAYRRFARRAYALERSGMIAPGDVSVALKEYGAAIDEAFGRPMRAPVSRFEALLTLEPEGMQELRLRLSSASNVEDTLYKRARTMAKKMAKEAGISWSEAFENVVGRINAAAQSMGVVEDGIRLSLPELATRLYNEGISRFESGTLEIEDATVSRLSGRRDIRRAGQIGENVLAKYITDPLPAPGTFRYSGSVEALKALSGKSVDELIEMAQGGESTAWWALGELAYSPEVYEDFPEGARAKARAAIGLDTGNPGDVILTHGKAHVGKRLSDIPGTTLEYHVRPTSTTPAKLQEQILAELSREDRIPVMHGRVARKTIAEQAEDFSKKLFRESIDHPRSARRWVPWAVAGGIGLIIANQVARDADIAPTPISQVHYAPPLGQDDGTTGDQGQYGLDIQISARNPGSVNLEGAAYQLAYGIESQTGIPMQIQLTQRDQRVRVDRATVEKILAAQLS